MKFELITILAILGFFLSLHIYRKISRKEKIVCVIGKDCDKVLKSKFGKTFGIDNTLLGMAYYVVVFILAFGILIFPTILDINLFNTAFLVLLTGAAAFSLYLTIIQLFILKELCEYCLMSALNTILIFIIYIIL